jgi:hypothetical protein
LRNRTGGTNGAGDGNRTHGIQLGKLAFYFHEIQDSLKFSQLQIIAIISMPYGPRIPRTDLHGTHPLSRFSYFYGQYGQYEIRARLPVKAVLVVHRDDQRKTGAGDGDRTRNQRLGKPLLYH